MSRWGHSSPASWAGAHRISLAVVDSAFKRQGRSLPYRYTNGALDVMARTLRALKHGKVLQNVDRLRPVARVAVVRAALHQGGIDGAALLLFRLTQIISIFRAAG
jgi:hypothetical protein